MCNAATNRLQLSLGSDLRLKRQICLQPKKYLFLRTLERGSEHMKYEPLSADQQCINVHAIPLGIEWAFVQNEHDMKHSSIADEVEVGSDQWPKLEALRCLIIHLGWIANQGQSKKYVGHYYHHHTYHLRNLHVLHVTELGQNPP